MPTTITVSGAQLPKRSRLYLSDGSRCVVKSANETTATVAWRNAWYWRAWWAVLDGIATLNRVL